MRFIPDTNDWLQRRQRPVEGWRPGEWTIIGGDLYITPTIAADETGWFVYLDKNCINLAGGGVSDTFQNDNDTFRLDERLLKLGMIMQWKANKGNAYAEDMGTWQDAMNKAMGADSPSPILIGRLPISASRIAYPWAIP
jgi:hypothetical protein